jgi:hypothetical protein
LTPGVAEGSLLAMDEIVDPAAGASEGGAEQVAEPAKDSREAQRAALRERRAKS